MIATSSWNLKTRIASRRVNNSMKLVVTVRHPNLENFPHYEDMASDEVWKVMSIDTRSGMFGHLGYECWKAQSVGADFEETRLTQNACVLVSSRVKPQSCTLPSIFDKSSSSRTDGQ